VRESVVTGRLKEDGRRRVGKKRGIQKTIIKWKTWAEEKGNTNIITNQTSRRKGI